ncbi:unnamed protein product [Darwinula stevensoni]|uniref:Uncharacterized protein n=1 Tax=Darwinula stevensoni TaxID=69355 RepID=A0A7R8X9U2_9CRUS|nr:unnamed protein product [Darwinula stevensoni]CAG0890933.1 unnamed protein product [Darwinula stevensoni]
MRKDERNQALGTNVEVIQRWTDVYLKWDPTDYGGIEQIAVPYSSIWTPDIILLNSASTNYAERLLTTNAIVSSTGEVILLTDANFRSTCDVDVSYFPFDTQNCKLCFRSWSQDVAMNAEFTLESYEAEERLELDPCCPNPFSAVHYAIRIKRRASFFVVSYVFPMVIINFLALLVFLMPNESGEKVTLGISAMLTTIVFLMSIRDVLSHSENISLLGKYCCASLSLITIEVALSIFTLYLHHLKDIRVSHWIQNVCRLLAKLTCMKEPNFRTVCFSVHLIQWEVPACTFVTMHSQVMVGECENEKGAMGFADGIPVPSLFGGKNESSGPHAWEGPVELISNEPITERNFLLMVLAQ